MLDMSESSLWPRRVWPLLFFLVSALIAALISYNSPEAWFRFVLIVAGLALLVVFALLPEQVRILGRHQLPLLSCTLLLFPALVSFFFLLSNNWASRIGGKLPWLDPVLRPLAAIQLWSFDYRPDPNVIGGILAMLLPLQVAVHLKCRGDATRRLSLSLTLVTVVALLLSELRGAWLALAVAGGALFLWRWLERLRSRGAISLHGQLVTFSLVLAMAASGTLTVLLLTPIGRLVLGARSDRVAVWGNSLALLGDYFFTGLGLGSYEMSYSSYVYLVHVNHTSHAHNLYVNLWLQQGLLGLLAFCGLVLAAISPVVRAIWNRLPLLDWQAAAIVSLMVILLHGVIDDPYYGYAGKGIPFLFIPFGLLLRGTNQIARSRSGFRWTSLSVVAGIIAALFVPGVRAQWEANLGALSQTRAELSVYHWPQWSIQDELRRSSLVNLTPAIGHFSRSLILDNGNTTANRRLGQIELSRGEYDAARHHLEAAYAAASHQRATRQMLGEVCAIAGQMDLAAKLWRSIDVSANQLEIRRWWYEHINETQRAGRVQHALQMSQ
jgi:O-antigen ligase